MSRRLAAVEVFKAYRIECPECASEIVLRPSLEVRDSNVPGHPNRCTVCRNLLDAHVVLGAMMARKVVEMVSFDCEECGRECLLEMGEPIRCIHCGTEAEK